MYTEKFISYIGDTVKPLIGQVRKYEQIWKPEELELLSEIIERDSEGGRKQKVLRQQKLRTNIFRVPSMNGIFITV